jgi:ABC-type bacteriocin/lantibiotic exporter with double-glycine peptidase domain
VTHQLNTLAGADVGPSGPLNRLWSLMRGSQLAAVSLMAVKLVSTLSEALFPLALGLSVTAITAGEMRALVATGSLLLILIVVRILLSVVAHVLGKRLEIGLGLRLKNAVGARLATTDTGLETGEAIETASGDTETVSEAYGVLLSLVVSAVVFVVVGTALLVQSVVVGLVILAAAPILAFGLPAILRPLTERLARHRELAARVSALSVDVALGLKTLKGVGGEDEFVDRFRRVSAEMREAGLRVASLRALIEGAKVVIPTGVVLAVLAVGLTQLAAGEISTGQLVAFYALAVYLVGPVTAFVNSVQEIGPLMVASDRVWRALHEYARPESGEGAPANAPRNSFTVLEPSEADLVASTSLRGAEVLVSRGDDYLFEGRVRDLFGDRVDPEQIERALTAANANDVVAQLGGLDGRIDDAGGNLSGGQRQRLALARAIAADSEILVLVNPTSAVDTVTEWRICRNLVEVRTGRTTVVVTDSPTFAHYPRTVRDESEAKA